MFFSELKNNQCQISFATKIPQLINAHGIFLRKKIGKKHSQKKRNNRKENASYSQSLNSTPTNFGGGTHSSNTDRSFNQLLSAILQGSTETKCLRNYRQFARQFKCLLGSGNFQSKTREYWIWHTRTFQTKQNEVKHAHGSSGSTDFLTTLWIKDGVLVYKS